MRRDFRTLAQRGLLDSLRRALIEGRVPGPPGQHEFTFKAERDHDLSQEHPNALILFATMKGARTWSSTGPTIRYPHLEPFRHLSEPRRAALEP